MIDLLVVHPGAQHGIYGALGDSLTALEPPTWARMIAGYVRDRGYSVAVLDTEAERLSPLEAAERARRLDPRLVAIVVAGHQPSASTQQMTSAGEIARAIITFDSGDRRVVMLGNHPSALPERTLREEAVHYVIDGEGPASLVALLDLLTGRPGTVADVPGLVYWTMDSFDLSGRIARNPRAPLAEGDDLLGDAWDLLPMGRYRAHNWQVFDGSPRTPYASVYTSLQCPHGCEFCMINTMFGGRGYRRFAPERVVAQVVKLYRDYGVRTLKFADEMFVLNRSHVTEICEGLVASGVADDLNIWAYSRVDSVLPDILDLMRRAGIRWLALGIESGSAHVRDGAGKRLRRDDIVDVVRTIQGAGIAVIGNFMFGLRDDTRETMQQTLDLALACRPEFANFYCCMAYPGSRLYERALAEGWALPETWRGYSQHNDDCRPLDTEHVSGAEVLRFRDAAFRTFFADAGYRGALVRRFGPGALAEVDRMLSYRLERKHA